MEDKFTFDSHRESDSMTIEDAGVRHRITVPLQFLHDELGDDAGEQEHQTDIQQNLPSILQACLAKQSGGYVRAPWGRLMIEEIV